MFTGLSAFPLTPVTASGVDEKGFSHILSRLTDARVDSMGILGSTGSYAYLTREHPCYGVCGGGQYRCDPASGR